jgi:hypothetical protein
LKKLAFLGGAAGLGLIGLLGSSLTDAADHLDNTALATNPMADINDVYAWMTTDTNQINLAMTVAPFAPATGTPTFGPSVLYSFHISSRPGFGMAGVESKIICKFASNTNGECWVVDPMNRVVDYVRGDLSGATGRVSTSGKFRVFAGLRSDPFFFNLGGFKNAVTGAITACGGACPGTLTPDAAGCPQITKAIGDNLRAAISTAPTTASPPCAANQIDCFATANIMAIVIQIDKSEVVKGMDKLVTVWGSTHAGS